MSPEDTTAAEESLTEAAKAISGLLEAAFRYGVDTRDGAEMLVEAVNIAGFLALVGKRLVVSNPVGAFAASREWGSR